jgi:hypothetical protein
MGPVIQQWDPNRTSNRVAPILCGFCYREVINQWGPMPQGNHYFGRIVSTGFDVHDIFPSKSRSAIETIDNHHPKEQTYGGGDLLPGR